MSAVLWWTGWAVATAAAYRLAARYWQRRHDEQRPPCHFCEMYAARTDSLWCSAACADAELGVLGVTQ